MLPCSTLQRSVCLIATIYRHHRANLHYHAARPLFLRACVSGPHQVQDIPVCLALLQERAAAFGAFMAACMLLVGFVPGPIAAVTAVVVVVVTLHEWGLRSHCLWRLSVVFGQVEGWRSGCGLLPSRMLSERVQDSTWDSCVRNREVVPFGFILPSAWLIRVSVIAGTAAPSASSACVRWLPTYTRVPFTV